MEYWFDEQSADRVCHFFETYLRHSKGEWAGTLFILQEWQRKVLRDVFGWKRPDGTRRYRTVYIEIPRKNGKSTFLAGLSLYMLLGDGEPGAEVYSAACDKDTAKIIWEEAKRMVLQSPALAGRCKTFRNSIAKLNSHKQLDGSFFQPLSSDADTKHGKNIHCAVVDELHVQADRDLWDVLDTSTGSRRSPLIVGITTAGYDKTSLCYQLHEQAIRAAKGESGLDSFYSVIFAADEKDDIFAEATWHKANPGLGNNKKLEYMREQALKAK